MIIIFVKIFKTFLMINEDNNYDNYFNTNINIFISEYKL